MLTFLNNFNQGGNMIKPRTKSIGGLIAFVMMGLLLNPPGIAQSELKGIQFDDGENYGGWLISTDDEFVDTDQKLAGNDLVPVSYNEFNFNRRISTGEIHLASASNDEDTLSQIGLSLGGVRLDAFTGSGKSTLKIRNQYASVDPYLFHGGTNLPYDYNGFTLTSSSKNRLQLSFSDARIVSAGLQDRTVHSLGIATKNTKLTIMEVYRGDSRAGSVLSLSVNYRGHRLALDYLSQANGANYQGLNYARRYKGVNYRIAVQHTENPLYIIKNENRVVFSMDFRFGRRNSRFSANEEEQTQPQKQEKKANKAILAGGIIGAGIAISSGSSSSDSSPRFTAQTAVARAVLNDINPVSIAQKREFGGFVFRNADGSFGNTAPIRGQAASVALPNPSSAAPVGAVTTATYHTHAAFDPRFDNENFSPTDIASDNFFGLDGYLGTPAGAFKFHLTGTDAVVTLGTISVE
jgi:hypothetical protein